MSEKPTIRDGVLNLAMELCHMYDRVLAEAKNHAINALDGDAAALSAAKDCRSMAAAYKIAMSRVDDFRQAIERGEFQ